MCFSFIVKSKTFSGLTKIINFIIILGIAGSSLEETSAWMLAIDGKVAFMSGGLYNDLATGMAVLFAAYYVFNLEYQDGAANTLEYIQRLVVRYITSVLLYPVLYLLNLQY